MNVDLAQIEAGLETLSGFDFTSALDAFRRADLRGEIATAEDVASALAPFVPDAIFVKDALVLLDFIVEAREAGLIQPASVESPAMERASGHSGVG